MSLIRSLHNSAYTLSGVVAIFTLCFCHSLSAASFGPPLTLFQDIPPGYEVDLEKVGNFTFNVGNKDKSELLVTIRTAVPTGKEDSWEYGFEPIPDISWCVMKETELKIAAESTKKVGMVITIPDKPEFYNRKFMVYVILEPGGQGALGVGLGIIARVMIETTVKADVETLGGKSIAIAPGQIIITGAAGSSFSQDVSVRNNEDYDIVFQQAKLSDFYQELKHSRYQTNGFVLMPQTSWISPLDVLSLKALTTQKISIKGKIPTDLKIGSKHEEVLFLKPSPLQKPEDMSEEAFELEKLGNMSFLRIQYVIE